MDGKYSAVFCRGVGFEPLRRALVLSREPMDPGYKEMKELEQDDYANVDESWKAEIDDRRAAPHLQEFECGCCGGTVKIRPGRSPVDFL